MFLRPLVLILLLANLAWFAWAQGYLRPWGLGPAAQSEPQRLQRQLHPEWLHIERAGAKPPAAPPPPHSNPETTR